jgi:tripartite-type tricarboxylate transporter receptor subunit TctC
MTIHATRRQVIASLASVSLTGLAHAQDDYPRQPINFICAFPPGSGADILVRFWANRLKNIVPQTIVVQNKPGAMANIAAEFTARSKPDGYNILVHAGSTIAANMHIFKKPPFDVVKDLKVATTLSSLSFILVVPKNSPYKNLQELTAALKAKGDKGSYGTANTPSFVIGKLYTKGAGLQTVQVNYKTSMDFVNDLNAGHIDFAITDSVSGVVLARQGHWRTLAVGSNERMKSLPDLPTFAEGGVSGVDLLTWWGAMVPAGTPDAIVQKIHGWFEQVLKEKDTADYLREQANDVMITPLAEAQTLLRKSEQEWKRLVEETGVEKI